MVYFCLNKGIYKVLHKVSSRAKRRISSVSSDALGTCGGIFRLVLLLFCFSHIPHFGECGENTPEFPEFIQFNHRIE